MISINNNMGGMKSMDALQQSHRSLQTALERLSTGVRINRAEDDAAGLMVRDRFQAQVNGFEEAIRNIQTGSGMIQVAEQALNKVTEALQQMRALAVRAADDNLSDEDRGRIQAQVKGLLREINERAASTAYNGHKLLDGSIADSTDERLGQARIQSNSFLASGSNFIRAATTTGTAATTANAVSQGSYQVRLVHSGSQGVTPSATGTTTLRGTINSGPNGDGAADATTVTQVITDRNGGAHNATVTFNQVGDGSRNYTYSVSIPAGGVYASAQSFSGTLSFNADGTIDAVDNRPAGDFTRSVTLADGTATGQPWTIDFGSLAENQHATTLTTAAASNAAAATSGSAGVDSTGGTYTGRLSDDGTDSTRTATVAYVDRLGVSRNLDVVFTRNGAATTTGADLWDWSVTNNPAWGSGTASITAGGIGSIQFAGGTVSTGGAGSVTITDSGGIAQTLALDFSALTNAAGASTAVGTANDGTAGTPTTSVAVTSSLVSGSATPTATFSVVDRTGVDSVAGHTITFTETAANQWAYTITPNASSGFTGTGTNLTGTVVFNSQGTIEYVNGVQGATTVAAIFDDASTEATEQAISFDLSGVSLDRGTQATASSNGLAGTTSSTLTGTGNLDGDHVISDTVTTGAFTVVDRTGTDHSVSISYTKVSADASGEVWSYSINGLSGGVWTGVNSGNESGTLTFSAAGALTAINGGSPAAFTLSLGDGTSAGQSLTVSLTGLTNTAAADSATGAANGSAGIPTDSIVLADNLVSGAGPFDVPIELVDRTGTNHHIGVAGGAGPRVTFSQVGESKVWNYTVTTPASSGFNGFGSGLQGQVEFDDAGNIVSVDGTSTLTKSISFGDGTAEGQGVTLSFANLNMARADDLADSSTDGGSGTSAGEVSAVIYFSDGNGSTDVNPVSTLTGVDIAAKTFSAGGISITVEQASTLDVGLTSYIKAYTYVSATTDDRSLTFQVGADEGDVTRVGISRMDVDTIFRRNDGDGGTSSYLDITLDNALKAQDLIGQIDDALNFVGGENLKVGTFQNKFMRTLDLARSQMTSISGALSNINDADMAREATNQSKRSILVQSGTAMVAQANSQGQFLLQLLR